MALGRIRTKYGHGAGKKHGRWMKRADAKLCAAKKRRKEDREAERGPEARR